MNNRNPKKIMMASSVHVWSDTRIYFKEAQTLANQGFQVDFYALDHPGEKINIPNLTMHYLKPQKRYKRFIHWRFLYKEMIQSDATYFHFHDPELLLTARALKKKLKDEIKITYDMHEHLPAAIRTKQWLPRIIRPILSQVVAYFEKKWMKYCDTVIFAELSYKDNYEELTLNKVDVLNYPIFPNLNELIMKDNVFTMIYVGVLTEQRGLFNMLQLAKSVKDRGIQTFKLKLIGPIFTDEERVQQFIVENHLSDNIELHGRMQYKDIWAHYQAAHVGLCLLHPTPNNLNSHSTKLFEYMAAGLPIVASDFPDFTKMLTEHDCGKTSDPEDYDALYDIIDFYMANPEKNKQFGENGKEAFNRFYNWEREGEKLSSIYSSED
ncbi:glycosyltransferase family 4 protein [Listeria grandensis]|uniref:glycosyltransferase family 4 protein n=1 Tax=Listeria grandensis TaxID=1494963 RepID=UPI00162A75FF|nr:glycosyltransferase family 4 protein [Listeria grandensis]MBC1473829.1 glycosyltransferase family 4 protein [Listeria grandensis]